MKLPEPRDPREMRDDTPEPDWQAEYQEWLQEQERDKEGQEH